MKARAISRLLGGAAASLLVAGFVYAQQPPAPSSSAEPEEAETPYDAPAPSASASAPPPSTSATAESPPPYVGPGLVKPEAFGPKAMPASADRPREKPRSRGPDGKLIGGIIAAVVGAGALVTFGVAQGQIAYLQDDPAYEKYRRGLAPSQSACDEAKAGRVVNVGGAAPPADVVDLCKTANTYELVSYAMLPTGIVMLGLGGYLVFTSDTARGRATLEIAPRVGWNTAGADLTVSF